VGCGHSGTSLLLAILGAHSRLHDIPFESRLAFKSSEQQYGLLEQFKRETIASGKRRWVEKTPTHVRKIPELFRLSPDAQILVMLRDGRDVACSIRARTGSFEKGVLRWVEDNRSAEEYLENTQVHRVRYENIVENFDDTIRSVTKYIGESFEPKLRKYHEKDKYYYDQKIERPESPEQHEELRNWQVNQPVFDGRGRWKSEMGDDEKKIFKKNAGEMLVKYGYEDNLDW
jgi:hypothetical protein